MLQNFERNRRSLVRLHEMKLPNSVIPCNVFDPSVGGVPTPHIQAKQPLDWKPLEVSRPSDPEDLAFMPIAELAALLKARKVTSVELTELYLGRLKKFD